MQKERTMQEWQDIAARGNATAMCWVGLYYHQGKGVKKDDTLAVQWYRRAIEAGSVTALFFLATCYLNGTGVTKDKEQARAYMQRAADGGNAKAVEWLTKNPAPQSTPPAEEAPVAQEAPVPQDKVALARDLFDGRGGKKDVETAMRLYQEAAEEGVPEAQEYLALSYRFGNAIEKNAVLAAYWYLRAQKTREARGETDEADAAMDALAMMEQDGGLASGYLKMRMAFARGDAQAAYEVYDTFRGDAVYAQMSLYFCAMSAEGGYPTAQLAYADYFAAGKLVPADAEKSKHWLSLAAKGGDREARYRYGCLLLDTGKEEKEAIRLLAAAADAGHLEAQLKLGRCYEYGTSVERDAHAAARLYRQVADKSSRACYLLGNLYLTGRLRDEDPRTALEWYRKGDSITPNSLGAFGIAKCTRDGVGVPQDAQAANRIFGTTVQTLEQMVADGDPIGLSCLAELHFYGMGGMRLDPKLAEQHYLTAAEMGEPIAKLGLADCYTRSSMLRDPERAAYWYARAAESGIPAAQYSYGICLRDGNGTAKDPDASKAQLRAAAEGGNSEAQYTLGEYYAKGLYDTKTDMHTAVEWYGEAARSGHGSARYALGQACEKGIGMEKNPQTAIEWYKSAAEVGNASANCRLGELIAAGEGLPQDDVEAAAYFTRAAKTGHVGACYHLGTCYEGGRGVPRDSKIALEWYKRAGALPDALYACGAILAGDSAERKDLVAALSYFKRAAEAGHAGGMFRAAYQMLTAKDRTPADVSLAKEYLAHATELGHPEAAYTLAVCYADGRDGTERSHEKAFLLFSRAAEAEHSDAQCRLGVCYACGYGVEKNPEKAVSYFKFAAEQGHAIACYRLAKCYDDGIGTMKNPEAAERYYKRAAELGNPTALAVLGARTDGEAGAALLKQAIAQGNAEAAWELALRLSKNGDAADKATVANYLQIAAKSGHVKATYQFGLVLDSGEGVPIDHAAATDLYRRAAERGYPPAEYRYGLCLALGHGTKKDITTAKLYLARAAKNGMLLANEALASIG